MKKTLFILILVLIFTSCSSNNIDVSQCTVGNHVYGFWGGFWHGLTAPFNFFGMLLSDDNIVYAPNTNGAWYAFGFLMGSGGWGFLGGRSSD